MSVEHCINTKYGGQRAYRLLIVFAPSRLSHSYLEQSSLLAEAEHRLRERDIVIIQAFADGIGYEGNRALNSQDVAGLRDYFSVEAGEFLAVLIGKDGFEKMRSNAPVSGSEICELIDAVSTCGPD